MSLIRAESRRTTIGYMLPAKLNAVNRLSFVKVSSPAYRSFGHIPSWAQHRLQQKHITTTFCDDHTVDLDSDVP